jgi:hypothetical protein
METATRNSQRLAGNVAGEAETPFGPQRRSLVAREILGCAAILALWITLWMSGAATLTQPWAPDPETRAALQERTQSTVVMGGHEPARR